ncbi:DUF4030 domain-containing protein [Bacillus sp. JJ722]|uniref:DUF4030 domain-containing protein n=1 Tax=Bacillus sp. JJ722 TaxID=3122973 RepID=UPI002FFD58B1
MNKIKEEFEKIEVPEELFERAKLGVKNAKIEIGHTVEKNKKPSRMKKRLMILSTAAVVIIGLFFSPIFSPTMAKVVTAIPFLGSLFEKEESVTGVIYQELKKEGYQIDSVGAVYKPKKEIEIRMMGSEDYYEEVKEDVKKQVENILESRGYDAFSVAVRPQLEEYIPSKEEQETINVLESAVKERLTELDYSFDEVMVDPVEKVVFINMNGSKQYAQSDHIEKEVKQVIEKNKYEGFKVKVNGENTTINERKDIDVGSLITSEIGEPLMSRKEYKVTGISYKEEPAQIFITTSFESTDQDSKAIIESIEATINEFLHTKEMVEKIKNQPYEIIIESKNNKRLNH